MKTERILRIFSRYIMFTLIMVSTSFLWASSVFADYVLPYPSFMPGNKVYKISRLVDTLKQYWNFGNIAQIKYHMALSDKYLVEAKTLFEYNQYLLAVDALHRSNIQFSLIPAHIAAAKQEGKDITVFETMVRDEAAKHKQVLNNLILTTPETFIWKPEKDQETTLSIRAEIQKAITVVSK